MWLTRLALRNPILVLMLSLMTIVLGVVSMRRLSVDLFPDIAIPTVRVATFYSGAGPTDIEKTLTQPVERAVAGTPGVERVESVSKQGVSLVTAWFAFGSNLDAAQFEVQQRISQILNTLPAGIQQPFVLKFDITNIPVTQVAVASERLDERELYDLAYNTIQPQLERLTGVASATVGGGLIRELGVRVQRDALLSRSLGILDVVQAVRGASLLLPSGNLRTKDRDFNVFSNTQLQNLDELGEVIVRGTGASAVPAPAASASRRESPLVRLADIARLEEGTADRAEIVRINGRRGVTLRVLKQPGANTIAVVDAVRAALPKLSGVPADTRLTISFDQSSYIRNAVASLKHEALTGGLLAILVILIFLASWQATGIVAIAIPLSVIATFILLYFTGQSLNVFTMGGLALGVGRLVDDSIVELENIHRHLEEGKGREQAVLDAASEVAMPILVSTITTIVVFLPVLFLQGVARSLFLPLAATISFSLMMSFFVSRTVTPVLCLRWLDRNPGKTRPDWLVRWRGALDGLEQRYAGLLAWALRRRGWTLLGILAPCAASLLLLPYIGSEFFPESDESQFTVNFRAPIGTRVETAEQVTARIEDTVRKVITQHSRADGDAALLLSTTGLPAGRTALFTNNTGPHTGNVQANLRPPTQRSISDLALADKVRVALRQGFPGTQLFVTSGGIVKRILNFGAAAPIDVEVLGHELEAGSRVSRELAQRLRGLVDAQQRPLLTDVQVSREDNAPELRVQVDRTKAGAVGLAEQDIAQTVLASLLGNQAFAPVVFSDPRSGYDYGINVRLDDPYRSKVSDLEDLSIRTPRGQLVPLDALATVERASGPTQIERKYLRRIVHVTANVAATTSLGAASEAVTATLAKATVPDGFEARLGGQSLEQAKAFSELRFAALLALVLVYMVLSSEFKSLLDPLVIMVSVPLGIAGVLLMLWATGTTLNVNSTMGIIMMIGIVVSNGVLLVDFAHILESRGSETVAAAIEAGRLRLRPILMTSIATVVGLLPMALGLGEGAEANLPLARAVIGGLSVSTLFTLFLVPVLHVSLRDWRRRRAGESVRAQV